ncbi:flagellar hook-length control protein FliK [Pseudidiomarina maritima]|nr:flagellar hook-length control protein FliK [Pseudidiomarina maritima]
MMVNFNNLMTTTQTNAKGAPAASDGNAPATGFAALFAALQSPTAELDQAPSAAQLQQLAANLQNSENPQLLEEIGLEQDLTPEALAQILSQLQQLQPQAPSAQVMPEATAINGVAPNAIQSTQSVVQAMPQVNQQQSAVAKQSTQQLNQAILKADNVKSANVIASTLSTPAGVNEPQQFNQQQIKPETAQQLSAELKQVDTKATIDTSRLAPTSATPTPTAGSTLTSSAMSASIVMIDAPVTQGAQAPVATPSTTAATATMATPVGSQAWANQLQQNVMQMVMHNQNEMTLRLHPAELGPLQVQLRMDDSTAQLNILTHSQHVRGALEQAMPTLRDALANQGIQLGDSQVSDQSQQFMQQHARQQAQQWTANAQQNEQNTNKSTVENSESAENTDMGVNSRHTAAAHNGQVDTFA